MPQPKEEERLPTTLEEFLAWQEERDEWYEFINGEVAVRGATTPRHDQIAANVIAALHAPLRDQPCRVLTTGSTVEVESGEAVRPDALVTCETSTEGTHEPVVVVEVSSPGSSNNDYRRKRRLYEAMPSVRHYLLIEPDERLVWHFEKQADGLFMPRMVRDGTVLLDPPGVRLDLAAVYAGIPFDA